MGAFLCFQVLRLRKVQQFLYIPRVIPHVSDTTTGVGPRPKGLCPLQAPEFYSNLWLVGKRRQLPYSDHDTKKDMKRFLHPDHALTRAKQGSTK